MHLVLLVDRPINVCFCGLSRKGRFCRKEEVTLLNSCKQIGANEPQLDIFEYRRSDSLSDDAHHIPLHFLEDDEVPASF